MHRALCISEIISPLFAFLALETSRGQKLSMALVCKAWKEPGLNELWEELHFVAPIAVYLAAHKINPARYPSLVRGETMLCRRPFKF